MGLDEVGLGRMVVCGAARQREREREKLSTCKYSPSPSPSPSVWFVLQLVSYLRQFIGGLSVRIRYLLLRI